jgi:hypothetical protein
MLVKARPRAQPWAVRWEFSAGAMREGDRHRAGTGDAAAPTTVRLVTLHLSSNSASNRLNRLHLSSFAWPYVAPYSNLVANRRRIADCADRADPARGRRDRQW